MGLDAGFVVAERGVDVAQHADPDAVLVEAQTRTVDMFMPEVVADGDEFILSTPAHYTALMAAR